MRILRLIAASGEGFIRGLASGLRTATTDLEDVLNNSQAAEPEGDVQLWDRVRAHDEWERARIRAWRRRRPLHLVAGTTVDRCDGESFIAQLAEGRTTPGGDAA